jgi:hypothetical protein
MYGRANYHIFLGSRLTILYAQCTVQCSAVQCTVHSAAPSVIKLMLILLRCRVKRLLQLSFVLRKQVHKLAVTFYGSFKR